MSNDEKDYKILFDILGKLLRELEDFMDVFENIKNGKYNYILATNLDYIKKEIESGNISSKDRVMTKLSISYAGNNAKYLLRRIQLLKNIMVFKTYLEEKIEHEKTNLSYNENDNVRFLSNSVFINHSYYTYKQALELINKAEEFLKDGKIYLLLDFYLKNDVLIDELDEREKNIFGSQHHQEAHDIINMPDDELGIIVIDDSKEGKKVVAGTKKDILLSDVLEVPFPKDIDKPGFDYGPHGDYYSEPHKITKTFIDTDLTVTHKKMIEEERKKRLMAKSRRGKDELGFIKGLVVSRNELIDNGFNPDELGWKPLKVREKKQRIFKLYKDMYIYEYTLPSIVRMTVDTKKDIQESKLKNRL